MERLCDVFACGGSVRLCENRGTGSSTQERAEEEALPEGGAGVGTKQKWARSIDLTH